MTTTTLDVLGGSSSSGSAATDVMTGIARTGGMKAPCAVATLANVALSGLAAIDGFTPVAGDRILVWVQTNPVENGIYNASAGAWSRAIDCDGKGDLVRGTQVAVSDGDTHGLDVFMVTTANPITVGLTSLVWTESLAFAGTFATNAEVDAAVAATVIPGMIDEWGGTIANIPAGWLFCDGAAVSRATYSALFTAIGTRWGAGDGSTTFNLPDKRDKFSIGARQDDAGVPKTNVEGALTASGGSKDAVNVSHTHTATSAVSDPGHGHNVTTLGTLGGTDSALMDRNSNTARATTTSTTGITVATTVDSAGVAGTNLNLPPYNAAVWIIRT